MDGLSTVIPAAGNGAGFMAQAAAHKYWPPRKEHINKAE
jgi:hypothetical protein